MIANWHTKCSMDPPLFAVGLSKRGNTQRLIRESREFVVAIPNKDMVEAVKVFGTAHGNQIDKFKESGVETMRGELKTPLLKDATANMECKLFKEVVTGDHYLFIGEVVSAPVQDKKMLFNKSKDGVREYLEL